MMSRSIIYLLGLLPLIFISCSEQKKNIEHNYDVIALSFDFKNYLNRYHEGGRDIRESDVMLISCFKNSDSCRFNGRPLSLDDLQAKIETVLESTGGLKGQTSVKDVEYPIAGVVSVKYNLCVHLLIELEASYLDYYTVRQIIFDAYENVRERFCKHHYGKSLYELTNSLKPIDKQMLHEVYKIYHLRYSDSYQNVIGL